MMPPLTTKEVWFLEKMRQGPEQERVGFELLSRRKDVARFFHPLSEAGFFSAERNPAPIEKEPGSFRIPYWPALDFLAACASAAGQGDDDLALGVLGVIRAVSRPTPSKPADNYYTWQKFAEFFGLLPPHVLQLGDVDLVEVWLSSEFDTGLVTRALDEHAMPNLLSSSNACEWQKACRIVTHCTRLRPPNAAHQRGQEPTTAADSYWLKELLRHHVKSLGAKAGQPAAKLFVDRVREYFAREEVHGESWLVRPAIEDHSQNLEWKGALNSAIEGARDVLLAWEEADSAGAGAYIKELLADPTEALRRIAIFVANKRWDGLSEVFLHALGPRLLTIGSVHELLSLLSERFDQFPEEYRARTVEAICGLEVAEGGEDPELRRMHLQRRWLSAIEGRGYGPADRLYAEVSASLGETEPPGRPNFLVHREMRWGPGRSPFSAEELVSLSQNGTLLERLEGFKEQAGWREPTLEALVDALEAAAASHPSSFKSTLVKSLSAKPAYQYGLLNGLKRAWGESAKGDATALWNELWEQVVSYAEAIVERPEYWSESPSGRTSLVPAAEWIPPAVADFFRAGTNDDAKACPVAVMERMWLVLTIMLKSASSRVPGDEPMTWAINAPRGRVVEAVYSHVLRACRNADRSEGGHASEWTRFAPIFSSEAASCVGGNHEFSTISGAYLAQLHYLDPVWLRDHIDLLFPQEHESNFLCAVDGLTYSSITRPTYQLLVAAGTLDRAMRAQIRRPARERLTSWVCLAYLWGDEDLGSSRWNLIFESDDSQGLEDAVGFFWSTRDEGLGQEQLDRIITFWARCTERARRDGKPEKFLARLSLLACHVREIDERTKPLLEEAAPFAASGHNAELLIEELDRLATKSAGAAGRILQRVLSTYTPMIDFEGRLKSLIGKCAAQGERQLALEIADSLRDVAGMPRVFAELSGMGR